MGARGRKSAAALTTIGGGGVAVTRRPEPPACLGDGAAAEWRRIVNALPADWIAPGALPLLEAYCGLALSQRRTLSALRLLEEGDGEFDVEEWRRLQRQAGELSGRVASLATRLRLTPQSRYLPRGAARAAGGHREGPAPWECDR